MWSYNRANELYHVGIKGMHWGVRRGGRSTIKKARDWGKEAGTLMKNQYTHPIMVGKANRQSLKADTTGNKLRRTLLYQNTKDMKDINSRVDALLIKKAKVNEIKTKYRKEFMAGRSTAGKIFSKITNTDGAYANIMYNMYNKK